MDEREVLVQWAIGAAFLAFAVSSCGDRGPNRDSMCLAVVMTLSETEASLMPELETETLMIASSARCATSALPVTMSWNGVEGILLAPPGQSSAK